MSDFIYYINTEALTVAKPTFYLQYLYYLFDVLISSTHELN